MLSLLEYMLKVSVFYAAAYLFYWLVLSRLTSYKSNRFYLLGTMLLAFIMPLIKLDSFVHAQTIDGAQFINNIPVLNLSKASEYIPAETSGNLSFIPATVFIAGVIICLVQFITQLFSFKKIASQASLINVFFGVRMYHLEKDVMPFSFGNAVYVNKHKHSAAELNDIIKHESVHVHQQHTIDVIMAEIMCIFNWFNPFVWLMKKAIKQNLEFLADDTVLKEGADKKNYQYLLLKVTGYSPLSIASSFKLSSLKQRIYMMNKNKTSQKHLLKLFLILPLFAFILLAFRNTNTTAVNVVANMREEKFMLSELTYNIQDANVDKLVKGTQDKSLLQTGKQFTLTTIMNERDRLRSLLEKNGYSNINSHAITFMLDSTFDNKRCSIEINIDLKRKESSYKNSKNTKENIMADNGLLRATQNNYRLPTNRQQDNNM